MKNNIDFIYEKCYEKSNLKCDFFLPKYQYFIEIAGIMKDSDYREKIEFKKSKFNAIILENENEIINFYKGLK